MLWDPFLYCINDSIQGNSETGNKVFTLPSEVSINSATCGTQMECIGKEFVRHEFRFTPAKGKVVNIYRETYLK